LIAAVERAIRHRRAKRRARMQACRPIPRGLSSRDQDRDEP
jgi:hypothetical protein